MTLTVNATDFWGRETVQTLDIRSSQEAERALAELYRCLPQALRKTYQAVVFEATQMRSTKVSDRQMFGVEVATEKSNEDCGQGAWWLCRDNLYLTADGLVTLKARGKWRNYGHPSGTAYECDSAEVDRVAVTPENYERAITAVQTAIIRHNESRKKVDTQAKRLLALLRSI